MSKRSSTVLLAVLSGFLALTAAWGAIGVVPALPTSMLRTGPFTDFTLPAMGLGGVAVLSAAVIFAVTRNNSFAGPLAVITGVAIVVFEVVEMYVVGSLVDVPPGMPAAGYVGLWLQPFYFLLGTAMMILGLRAKAKSRRVA